MVAESGEEEQGIGSDTTCLEIYEKRLAILRDQDVVCTKVPVSESKGMELTNNTLDAKKELLVDWLMAPQGWSLDHLHREALVG